MQVVMQACDLVVQTYARAARVNPQMLMKYCGNW
jgi:hypothetical protein